MRRLTVFALLAFPGALLAAGPVVDPTTAKVNADTGVHWYDVRPLGIEGQG